MRGDEGNPVLLTRLLERKAQKRRNQQQRHNFRSLGGAVQVKAATRLPKVPQKRSAEATEYCTTADNNKMWDFYLDILIPANLVDRQANASVAFLPQVEETPARLLCQRIHLCRGVSKRSYPTPCPRSSFDGCSVAIVPRRAVNADTPLLLSSNQLDENSLIQLTLNCKPLEPTNNALSVVGLSSGH